MKNCIICNTELTGKQRKYCGECTQKGAKIKNNEWYLKNQEHIKICNKKYYTEKTERHKAVRQLWYLRNKEQAKMVANKYYYEHFKNDMIFNRFTGKTEKYTGPVCLEGMHRHHTYYDLDDVNAGVVILSPYSHIHGHTFLRACDIEIPVICEIDGKKYEYNFEAIDFEHEHSKSIRIDSIFVTTQVHKTLSCDFAISALLDPEHNLSQTGNLTAEYAEGRGGGISG